MKKIFFLFALILMAVHISYAAQPEQEEIVLTTYYPAPFGQYEELQVGRIGVGDSPPAVEGVMHFDGISYPSGTTPSSGDIYFDSTQQVFKYYNGTEWIAMSGATWIKTGDNIYVDNPNWKIGIGTATPRASLDINPTIPAPPATFTAAFIPPTVNADQRTRISPAVAGMVIYNSTYKVLQYYDGTTWKDIGGAAVSGVKQVQSGTQTVYTGNRINLSVPYPKKAKSQIIVKGVGQFTYGGVLGYHRPCVTQINTNSSGEITSFDVTAGTTVASIVHWTVTEYN